MNSKEYLETATDEVKELFELIVELRRKLENGIGVAFNRSLPFADLVFDRWARAKSLGFGEGSSVYDSCYVFGDVKVGKNTWIGPFTILEGSGKLQIGDYCSISAGVQIYTHDSVQWAVSGGVKPYEVASTSVGSRCYIGPNTVISKGVNLGEGCIVGANSFVNRSFPANSKIAGSPAKELSKS